MTQLICLTGAESTGKTTLAQMLAQTLDATCVGEVARDMLAPGERYTLEDVVRIGEAQAEAEARALAAQPEFVVADTDLLVIRVWLEFKYNQWPAALRRRFQTRSPRTYVLTAPDFPWQYDPLRENPADRDALHQRYRELLVTDSHPYVEVAGTPQQRLEATLSFLELT